MCVLYAERYHTHTRAHVQIMHHKTGQSQHSIYCLRYIRRWLADWLAGGDDSGLGDGVCELSVYVCVCMRAVRTNALCGVTFAVCRRVAVKHLKRTHDANAFALAQCSSECTIITCCQHLHGIQVEIDVTQIDGKLD